MFIKALRAIHPEIFCATMAHPNGTHSMVTTGKKRSKAPTPSKPTSKKSPAPAPAQPTNGSGAAASTSDTLRRMYFAMLKCRMMKERASNNKDGPVYDLTAGHEAIVVGASIDLKPHDTIAASRRNFAAHIAMGTSLKRLLKKSGATVSDESRAAVISGPHSSARFVADPFNLATGLALSHKLEKQTNVVVAFWEDDAASLEASHEALKFAGTHKLPIIYVTLSARADNLGRRKHSALEAFSFLAKDYGFPSILVDGKDVVAVWRAAQESIHRARNGSGPTLIECQTDATNFDDPLAHMEHYMSSRGAWDGRWKRKVVDDINAAIDRARLR
jgi:TPP-dependent pyruvate/acetoin dehydrogenase alpha subunit